MADVSTTFEGYAVDVDPDDWTLAWNSASDEFPVILYSEGIAGKSIRQEHSSDGHRALYWDDAGSLDDPNVLTRFRYTGDGVQAGIVLRGSGSAGSENGYLVVADGTQVRIKKLLAGVESDLLTDAHSLDPGRWYWLMARVVAGVITYRIWEHGQDEKTADDGSVADSDISSAGSVGLYFNDSRGIRYVDYIRIADTGVPPQPTGPDESLFDFNDIERLETGLLHFEDFSQADGDLASPWVADGDSQQVASNELEIDDATPRQNYLEFSEPQEVVYYTANLRKTGVQIAVDMGVDVEDTPTPAFSTRDGYTFAMAWTGGFPVQAEFQRRIDNGAITNLTIPFGDAYLNADDVYRQGGMIVRPGNQRGIHTVDTYDETYKDNLYRRFWLSGQDFSGVDLHLDDLTIQKGNKIVVKGLPDDYTIEWADLSGTAKAGVAVIELPIGNFGTTLRFPDTDVVVKDTASATVGTLTATETAAGGDVWSAPEVLNEGTIPNDAISLGLTRQIWRTQTSLWVTKRDELNPGEVPVDFNHWLETKGKIVGGFFLTGTPGAGLVLDTLPQAHEQEVEGRILFDAGEGSFIWSRYWRIELQKAGLIACGQGVWEDDPKEVSGVFLYVQTWFPWPFGGCGTTFGSRGVSIGFLGIRVVARGIVKFEDLIEIGPIGVVVRGCPTPWIGVKLRVTRDPTDPTLQTLDVKGAYDASGLIPDTVAGGWDLEVEDVQADVPCGWGGYAHDMFLTAWGGSEPGWVYYDSGAVANLGEICVDDMLPPDSITTPVILEVEVVCLRVFIRASPYEGPGVHTETRWVIRTVEGALSIGLTELALYGTSKAKPASATGDVVLDTGFQSDNLTELSIDLTNSPLEPFTNYTVEVEYRDSLGNTTPVSSAAFFTTATNPVDPQPVLVSIDGDLITVNAGTFSSPDPTSVHHSTSWELHNDLTFGEEDDLVAEGPLLEAEVFSGPELLEYTFDISGLGFEGGDPIYVRVGWADQYGCVAGAVICIRFFGECPPDLMEEYTKPSDAVDVWTKVTDVSDTYEGGCPDGEEDC